MVAIGMALRAVQTLPPTVFTTQHEHVLENLQGLADEGYLYQHQVDAVKAVKRDFDHPDHGRYGEHANVSLVVLPTGTGKSGVAILAAYCCNVKRVLVVTPSANISNQLFADFQLEKGHRSLPFLEKRGIFGKEDRANYMPNGRLIKRTADISTAMEVAPLVVVNAQKFGATSKVDLDKVPNRFCLVIVDEAHHYPAETWLQIVRHFRGSKILFLTATPYHRNKRGDNEYILGNKLSCFTLTRSDAIDKGIIRDTKYIEVSDRDLDPGVCHKLQSMGCTNRDLEILVVLLCMKKELDSHDQQDQKQHQGLVLALDLDEAKRIAELWNTFFPNSGECATYVTNSPRASLDKFEGGSIRVLVVIYRLTEGFDRKNVSVVAILRNVQPNSRVYFSQFVGRAVRKLDDNDSVQATVISHEVHEQGPNYHMFQHENQFVAQDDPVEPDE